MGILLQYRLGRYEEAEAAYKRAIELDENDAWPLVNLARLEGREGKKELVSQLYRQAIALLESNAALDEGWNLLLQAHLWQGNRDSARIALEEMAARAAKDDKWQFYRLREQARECHRLGIGGPLAALMDESVYRDFLRPLALALRAAGPEGLEVLGAAPPEMALLAREVYDELIAAPR